MSPRPLAARHRSCHHRRRHRPACTAGNPAPAKQGPKAEAAQTIEVWHGWSAPHEVKAFEDAIAGFHKLHPNITVKLVKGQDDDKILNAIRSGTPPDVVSSFSTNNVGQFCSSGALQDLTPYLKQDKVDMAMFPKAVQEYTQYKGDRCTLPAARRRLRALQQQGPHEGQPAAEDDQRADRAGQEADRPQRRRHHQGGRLPALGDLLRARPRAHRRPQLRRHVAERPGTGELRHRPGLHQVPAVAEEPDGLVRLRQRQEVRPLDGPGVRGVQPLREGQGRDGDRRRVAHEVHGGRGAERSHYDTTPVPRSTTTGRAPTAAGS